jgi:hypothetical protein
MNCGTLQTAKWQKRLRWCAVLDICGWCFYFYLNTRGVLYHPMSFSFPLLMITFIPLLLMGYAGVALLIASLIHLIKCSSKSKAQKVCWFIALALGNTLAAAIYYWAAWPKPVSGASNE